MLRDIKIIEEDGGEKIKEKENKVNILQGRITKMKTMFLQSGEQNTIRKRLFERTGKRMRDIRSGRRRD